MQPWKDDSGCIRVKEYNLLTQRLFAEGYTKDNYPNYVRGYNEFYGGFEYKVPYRDKLTYITPCGLLCKGESAMGGLAYKSRNWEFENDCPTILCPCYKKDCEKVHEDFRGHDRCAVSPTDREWTYEGSVEELKKNNEAEKERLKQEFIEAHNKRVCEKHMKYDPYKKEWSFHYDATTCANGECGVQTTSFLDGALCPVLNKVITRETGNVYYDVRFWGRDYTKDGTLFEGEQFQHIIKDVPLYQKPIRLEVAKAIAKTGRKHIEFMVRYNSKWYDSMTMYKAEKGEIDFHWAVENIRAEKKVARDLEADLRDIDDGIRVTHELDERKRIKKEKSDRKQERQKKRIQSLEKKIITKGYEALSDADKRAVFKYIERSRISELQNLHREKSKEVKHTQMSLFDLLEE